MFRLLRLVLLWSSIASDVSPLSARDTVPSMADFESRTAHVSRTLVGKRVSTVPSRARCCYHHSDDSAACERLLPDPIVVGSEI